MCIVVVYVENGVVVVVVVGRLAAALIKQLDLPCICGRACALQQSPPLTVDRSTCVFVCLLSLLSVADGRARHCVT